MGSSRRQLPGWRSASRIIETVIRPWTQTVARQPSAGSRCWQGSQQFSIDEATEVTHNTQRQRRVANK